MDPGNRWRRSSSSIPSMSVPLPPLPHYQSGAGEVYHSLAIGGHQHQHPHTPPHPPPGHVKEQTAITDSGATFIAYKPLNPTHKASI